MEKGETMSATAVLHSFPTRAKAHALANRQSCAVRPTHTAATCQTCGLRDLCLPAGLQLGDIDQLNSIINRKRPLQRGEYLYRTGSTLQSIFAVRTGFLKSSVLHDDGREQVAGFHMMGELLGLDAIGSGNHMCDAVALEDSEVCEIPFKELERLGREIPTLQQHFHRIMSREITRDYGVMLLLGSMRAEERLAAFLLNLSQRFVARGYSSTQFVLRMRREEIGSYLGLKLETVSRAFSSFQNEGLIVVHGKDIDIRDIGRIRSMLGRDA
jgi:CRP/FNR family transcriptional regulator